MCLLCGEAGFGRHGVAIADRPAHRLHGLAREGADSEAVRALIAKVKVFSDRRDALWKSPIVALSWDDRRDGFRIFVGVAAEEGEALPVGFTALDLPEMRFASTLHGPDDGDIAARYGGMIEWLRATGFRPDAAHFAHREEYPSDIDLSAPFALRLLLPVAPQSGGAR